MAAEKKTTTRKKAAPKTAPKEGVFTFNGEEYTLKEIQGDIIIATNIRGEICGIARKDVNL